MKNKKMLFVVLLVFIFFLSMGLTYAFFDVVINNVNNPEEILTSTGTLELTFNGGPAISGEDIFPGWSRTKTLTVTNTGSLEINYSINWESITNTFINEELVMSMTCTGEGCVTLNEVPVGNTEGPFIDQISISPGVTHTYELTIEFIDTGSVQNYNQGKTFGGVITVSESMATAELNSLFDIYGTLVNSSDEPIGGATITLMSEPRTTITDEDGNFMFEDVAADNHTITATLDDEEILNDELTIVNGEITEITDTTITRRSRTQQINVKIEAGSNERITSIKKVHYTLSPDWATILNINKPSIIAIAVETTLESPSTYTYDGVTYNRSQNGVDVSENTDGTVLASTYTDGTNEVIVMINSRGMTSLPEDSSNLFSDVGAKFFLRLQYLQAENLDTSQVTNMSLLFSFAGQNVTTFNMNLSNWDTAQVTTMNGMFESSFSNIENFSLDLSNWNTSNVSNMNMMFYQFGFSAEGVNINLSNWDTSQVSDMSSMFNSAGGRLNELNIKGFNLSEDNLSLVDYEEMFSGFSGRIIVGSQTSKDWIINEFDGMDDIIVDETIPTNNDVTINNGTGINRVLTLSSTNANRMCISNTSSNVADCTNWEGYKTTKTWKFPKTIGNHTLYVFYRMGTGTPSNAVSASTTVSSIPSSFINETFSDNTFDSNITITPDVTYPWIVNNGRFESTNQYQNDTTSSTTIGFTPVDNSTLSFDYGVSSESGYDELTITLTGSDSSSVVIVNAISGEIARTANVALISGVTYTLTLSYSKEEVDFAGDDIGYIDNLIIE